MSLGPSRLLFQIVAWEFYLTTWAVSFLSTSCDDSDTNFCVLLLTPSRTDNALQYQDDRAALGWGGEGIHQIDWFCWQYLLIKYSFQIFFFFFSPPLKGRMPEGACLVLVMLVNCRNISILNDKAVEAGVESLVIHLVYNITPISRAHFCVFFKRKKKGGGWRQEPERSLWKVTFLCRSSEWGNLFFKGDFLCLQCH